ncbi:conserved exported hypothetical protein [uncultured Eubacteriales bacterium]|uniref:FG-GAP repeat n=1 Tax=uncultured Eubacteriales bacterium TaxID=172733 RepID=A0A212KA46_9FIRM|nr:conserved exported hypothetical protein [uncultured Eubacteriales bacterium]
MRKYGVALCLALCLMGLLGGCTFQSVDELYALPKLPGDYQNLQAEIEEVTVGSGAEYSAPRFGSYTQPVQFQDLNGDGTLEALAFFKVAGDEKPLKIYIFRLTDNGYEVGAVVEGDGTAIYSISYENLNDTPAKELVVNWQKSTNVTTLAIYSIAKYEVSELLTTPCTAFNVMDIDMDNQQEVLVIQLDTVEGSGGRVDCYGADKAALTLRGSAPLSQGITALESDTTRRGYLKGDVTAPALYVTSALGDGLVTDLFTWKDEALKNVTLNTETGVSSSTVRARDKAKPIDLNGDDVLELPMPQGQPGGIVGAPTLDTWYQYDVNGNAMLVYTTYHNFDYGWYFILPSGWVGRVTVTTDAAVVGEERTVFSYWDGEKAGAFLTIYRLTGPNRHMRARMGENRFTLYADDSTIYCAEFTPGGWSGGLDSDGVKDHFKITQTDWSAAG